MASESLAASDLGSERERKKRRRIFCLQTVAGAFWHRILQRRLGGVIRGRLSIEMQRME